MAGYLSGHKTMWLTNRQINIAQGYAIASHPSVTDQWMVGTQDNGTNLFSPDQGAHLDGMGSIASLIRKIRTDFMLQRITDCSIAATMVGEP